MEKLLIDIKTLEKLAERMKQDTLRGVGLNSSAVASIADIIELAIGAPLMWPSRSAGADAAHNMFPGAPDLRAAFNAGIKWAVENYQPTEVVKFR